MTINPAAGKPADPSILVNVPKLITAYYELRPDPNDPGQRVVFGTSGHRGSAFDVAFNEDHILAITQAICDYRRLQKIDGPCFSGSIPMRCPSPHLRARWKYLRRITSMSCSLRARRTRRPLPSPTRFCFTTAGENGGLRTASSSRHITDSPMTGVLNTILLTVGPRIKA